MGKSILISANAAYVFNNIGKVIFNESYDGLIITAQENLTLRFSNDLEYHNDVSVLWRPLKANTPLTIKNGQTIALKGKLIATENGIGTFTVSGNFIVSGNILSLIDNQTMSSYQFKNLFKNCTTLVDASNIILPDYVTENCYEGMFYGCTSIEKSPELKAKTLQNNCYTDMFYACSSLTEITCKNISDISLYVNTNWVYGVALTGIFEIDSDGNWNEQNQASHIPANWEISTGVLTNKYLTFRILTNGTILWQTTNDTITKTISYSTDNGETWTDITSSLEGTVINVEVGNKILFKGNNTSYGAYQNNTEKNSRFTGTAKFNVEGNIMSLIDGDNFIESTSFNNNQNVFRALFQTSNVVSAKKLVLPVLTLTNNCYKSMFDSTQYLIEAPELPATTLAESCYYGMFKNAISLTKAPNLSSTNIKKNCYLDMFYGCIALTTVQSILPATTLNEACYSGMFYGCSSLTTGPALPATTMKLNCYDGMFKNCTSLTRTPEFIISSTNVKCCNAMFEGCTLLTNILCTLSATTLTENCYNSMFKGCTALTTTPQLPATTLASKCYQDMFKDCTALTAAPVLSATIVYSESYRSMFEGCSALTTAPVLSATTLADYCYYEMFKGCTSLTTAPTLSATTLADYCYYEMFKGCTSLTTAPALPATTLAAYCYYCMFEGCPLLTVAPDLLATTVYNNCYSGMFKGCSHLNYLKCMCNEIDVSATTWRDYMLTGVAATGTLIKEINIDWNEYVPNGWTITDEGVLNPTISCDGEEITLECQTTGATIYYQLNNTGNYVAYTGAISISADTTIRVYAELNGVTSTNIYSYCVYAPTSLLDPTIEFNYGTTITISCLTPNSTIYYRLNNTGSFIQYTEPIIINVTTTIEAYSELNGSTSNTVSETFTFINYNEVYFTIESLVDSNTISIVKAKYPSNINLSYSTNDGETWTDLTISATTTFTTINTGDKIIFKGINSRLATAWDTYYRFNGSGNFKVYGNIMSLLNGDNFINTSELDGTTNNHFAGLFYGTTTLIDANKLVLSASTLYYNSYNGMFRGCTNLVSAPQLQATVAGQECCSSMFEGCINLETVSDINFTTLAQNCCKRMFCMSRSTKLTTPKMTKSPILRCASGASGCYEEMFKGNGNLIEVTCLLTSNYQCSNWLLNGSSVGTFKKAPSATWNVGTSAIPSGWTVVDYVEE